MINRPRVDDELRRCARHEQEEEEFGRKHHDAWQARSQLRKSAMRIGAARNFPPRAAEFKESVQVVQQLE